MLNANSTQIVNLVIIVILKNLARKVNVDFYQVKAENVNLMRIVILRIVTRQQGNVANSSPHPPPATPSSATIATEQEMYNELKEDLSKHDKNLDGKPTFSEEDALKKLKEERSKQRGEEEAKEEKAEGIDAEAAYAQLKKDLFDKTKNPRTEGGDEDDHKHEEKEEPKKQALSKTQQEIYNELKKDLAKNDRHLKHAITTRSSSFRAA